MPFVVSGRLREPCLLAPAEFVTLAIREWELVMAWLAAGRARAYGRLSGAGGGAVVLETASVEEARRLAASLPFAPYCDVRVDACPPEDVARGLVGALDAAQAAATPARAPVAPAA
jgi:hypothetical protein